MPDSSALPPRATPSGLPVAVVTGATGGMGRAIVEDLALDHRVVALGRAPSIIQELNQLPNVEAHSVDLTVFEHIATALAGLDQADVVVHVAAVSDRFSVAAASVEDWRRQFDLNVVVPAEVTRILLPLLRASRGQVVFINSGAGSKAVAGSAVYSASKFALRALADSLRQEESEHGVRVATVAPGPTDTPMIRRDHENLGKPYEAQRYIQPRTIARAVRFVVDTGDDAQISEVAVRPRQELG